MSTRGVYYDALQSSSDKKRKKKCASWPSCFLSWGPHLTPHLPFVFHHLPQVFRGCFCLVYLNSHTLFNRAPYRASSTPIHTRDDNILLSETKGKDSDPDPQASSTWRTLGASVFLVLESSSFRDGIDITKVDRANCGSTLFATTTRRYLGDVATCQIPHLPCNTCSLGTQSREPKSWQRLFGVSFRSASL
ncbi:hypothetical protein GBA52_012242 [Prunus armeniaca]|nr:hypothetical protein GBA52_012242 [Prunus armeniaca]